MTFSVPFAPKVLSCRIHMFWILLGMSVLSVGCIFLSGSFVVHTFVNWVVAFICVAHTTVRRAPGEEERFGEIEGSASIDHPNVKQFLHGMYDDVKNILKERNSDDSEGKMSNSSISQQHSGLERRRIAASNG
eukprot:CAMPEP_0117450584 /NCGR_PEP_ID=MMETSP0759-20121206/8545_1 /TAXON_ID=63605 /ORGANISM="Percolomonas cosmopolitus, Strain WS" /LENGTH=132 /DNA_ID=CAMNT_0005243113 /DNA_START=293 /DNA_END=691 /DNA_ORIENTATION=+